MQEGNPVFNDLRDLLDWHFTRLSGKEKEILYWLAINRSRISIPELKEDILSFVAKEQISSTLQGLQHRIPLTRSTRSYTLQPVLIEYMTGQLIEQVEEEIKFGDHIFEDNMVGQFIKEIGQEPYLGNMNIFNSHALLKATAKD